MSIKSTNAIMKAVRVGRLVPALVFSNLETSKIAFGWNYGLSANTDGTVSSWGVNGYGQLDGLSTITNAHSVASSIWRTFVITDTGELIVSQTTGLASTVSFPSDKQYKLVDAGTSGTNTNDNAVVAVTTDDHVIGSGTFSNGNSAAFDVTVAGAKSVAVNITGVYALDGNGTIQHVFGNTVGTIPASTNNATQKITGGQNHVLALLNDGTVVAFGNNTRGQCDVPAGLTGVVDISAGRYHGMALKSDGTIVTWGTYYSGSFIAFPDFPTGNTYVGFASAYQSAFAYDDAGNLYGIGDVQSGQTSWTGSGYTLV